MKDPASWAENARYRLERVSRTEIGRVQLGWEAMREMSFIAVLVFFSTSMMSSKEWSLTRWSFLGMAVDLEKWRVIRWRKRKEGGMGRV